MSEETTATPTPAPEATPTETPPSGPVPTAPLTPETLAKATEGTGELDADDHMELERRFGIKPPAAEEAEEGEESEVETPASEPDVVAGTEPEKPPTMKAKIDGEEYEINVAEAFPEFAETWDKLSDNQKQRILSMHQKDVASSKRFSQASLTKKQMGDLMTLLKEDPMAVLGHKSLNHNVRELVEGWLVKQIDYENMDPQEKELAEAKKALAEKETNERRTKEEAERQEMEALQGKYTQHYQKDIISAVENSGLPKSTETVARIAYYLKEALKPRQGDDGVEKPGVRLAAADVVDLVRDDYQRMMKRLVGQADADTLIQLFGDEFTEKVRKHLLKPIKQTGKTPTKQAPADASPRKKKGLTKDEWKKQLDERTR